MNKIKWCFSIKKGLKKTEGNNQIADSYLKVAEKTLSKIKELIDENDFLWASTRIYYCAYYSLYSFLQKIGIKSENHDCSIELVKELIDEDFISDIEEFKKNRIDMQYYLKEGQKERLLESYKKVKRFYIRFKQIADNLGQEDITKYNKKIRDLR